MKSEPRRSRRKRSPRPACGRNALFLVFAFYFSLLALTACKSVLTPVALPPVAWADPAAATALLNARRAAVRTVEARATLRLTPARGKPQTLDAQLVHDAAGRARVRASKLNHNVLDLTVTPAGIWTAVSPRVRDEAPDAEAGLVRLAAVLPFLLRGPDYADARAVSPPRAPRLRLRWPDGLTAELDADTLTPLRFALADPGHPDAAADIAPVYTLYDANGTRLPWLRSVAATGSFGRIELTFHGVVLNQDLNPRAFRPPRRATAHPR